MSPKPTRVSLDRDSWGIDHGTWSVLVHAFPDADVPVVQFSIHALKDFDFHLELGTRLAPLRQNGIPTTRIRGFRRRSRTGHRRGGDTTSSAATRQG
jgi:hypothetical protein